MKKNLLLSLFLTLLWFTCGGDVLIFSADPLQLRQLGWRPSDMSRPLQRHWTGSLWLLSDLHSVDTVFQFPLLVFFWRSCFHLSSLPHRSDWPRAAVVLDDLDNLEFLSLKGNPELVLGPLPWPADSSLALGVLLLPMFIHPAVSRSSDQRLFLKNNINRGFFCKTESQIFKLLLSRLFHMTFGVCVSECLESHFFEFL